MKRRSVFAVVLLIALPAFSVRADVYRHPEGKFSFERPRGWNVVQIKNQQYVSVIEATTSRVIRRNIQINDQAGTDQPQAVIETHLANFRKALPGFQLLKRSRMGWHSGKPVDRLVVQHTLPGVAVRQLIYILPGRGAGGFILFCTVLVSDGERYDQLFDNFIRSFRP